MNERGVSVFNFEEYGFFNPSPNFREMTILQMISKDPQVSQENIAKGVGIVPSMVNRYLKDFEDRSFIVKTGENRRQMNYEITAEGKKRLQFLVVSFITEVSRIYFETKKSFDNVLKTLERSDLSTILLYGAGVVGGIVLKVLTSEGINVAGFIDDSIAKQEEKLYGINILNPQNLEKLRYDAVIIASFKHSEEILMKAKKYNLRNIFIFKIDDTGNVSLVKEE